MIKPHVTSVRVHGALEADSRTAGDTFGAGTTVAITTSTAVPIDTVIRVAARRTFPTPSATANAPTRPMYFAVLIVVLPFMSPRDDGRRVWRHSSVMGSSLADGLGERSSATLQFRAVSARPTELRP